MKTLTLKNFRGIDKSKDPSQLDINQAYDLVNAELKDGSVTPFKGWVNLFPMNYIPILDPNYTDYKVSFVSYNHEADKILIQIAWNNNTRCALYTIPLYEGLNNASPVKLYPYGQGTYSIDVFTSTFFMKGYQYFMCGGKSQLYSFFRWDGVDTVVNGISEYSNSVYVPILLKGCSPAGLNGTENQERNILSAKFTISYSSDGVATTYNIGMPISADTDEKVSIKVGTSTLTEGTHFTVDRTNRTVNFSAGTTPHGAPVAGTDNVLITSFYPTKDQNGFYLSEFEELLNRIKYCRKSILYGTGNDSRVFLYDNPLYPNFVYWSDVYEPLYYPESNYLQIGDKSSSITGIAKQLDSLVLFKESSTNESTIWLVKQEFDSNGLAKFTATQGVSGIGMDCSNTLQAIEDKPTFLSYQGVYRISSTNVKDERIFEHISKPINSELLKDVMSKSYQSFDYDGKYGIISGKTCYVFDYNLKYIRDNTVCYECYKWEFPHNITATAVIQGKLYLGCDNGMVYVVKTDEYQWQKHTWAEYTYTNNAFTNIETDVTAKWKLPYIAYGDNGYYKHIKQANISASTKTKYGLFSLHESFQDDQLSTVPTETAITSNVGWNTGSSEETYMVDNFIVDINRRDVIKHALTLELKRDITISQIDIDFAYGRKYKGVG